MSPSTTAVRERDFAREGAAGPARGQLDHGMFVGIATALIAVVAGVAVTGISARYFFQPSSFLIVIGGTLGVMLMTTPGPALLLTLRRARSLLSRPDTPNRGKVVEEIVSFSRIVRIEGMVAIEPRIDEVSHDFLREALLLAMDAKDHNELQSALEGKLRASEKQSNVAANVLEIAGGLTPTLGVLGTVIGLIDVLRQFSSLSTVAAGVGAAFTSTFYGLALANVLLLPVASRIRARAAETSDVYETMMEGVLCLFDGMHPRLLRQRLSFEGSATEGR